MFTRNSLIILLAILVGVIIYCTRTKSLYSLSEGAVKAVLGTGLIADGVEIETQVSANEDVLKMYTDKTLMGDQSEKPILEAVTELDDVSPFYSASNLAFTNLRQSTLQRKTSIPPSTSVSV